jgi:hypothetical protein
MQSAEEGVGLSLLLLCSWLSSACQRVAWTVGNTWNFLEKSCNDVRNQLLHRNRNFYNFVYEIGFESESDLLYDWRSTANQFILATSPLRLTTSSFISKLSTYGYNPYVNIFSDESMGLSFIIASGPRQRGHSQVRVPRDSWPYFTVSDLRLPIPGRPGHIYI